MFRLDGVDHGWIIKSVNSKETPNIDTFITVLSEIADRDRVPITYYSIADIHTINVTIATVEKHWSQFRLATRNDLTGIWDFTTIETKVAPKIWKPMNATFAELDESLGEAKGLFQSLVKINFYLPVKFDGFPKTRKQGAGNKLYFMIIRVII